MSSSNAVDVEKVTMLLDALAMATRTDSAASRARQIDTSDLVPLVPLKKQPVVATGGIKLLVKPKLGANFNASAPTFKPLDSTPPTPTPVPTPSPSEEPASDVRFPSRREASESIGNLIRDHGVIVLKSLPILERLAAMADDSGNADAREGALMTYAALCHQGGAAIEPFMVPQMPLFLERLSDKTPNVRTAAESAAMALARLLSDPSVSRIMPCLLSAAIPSRRWQTKEGAYKILTLLTETCPDAIRDLLPEIVPMVSDGIVDAREEVKKVAWEAAENSFSLAGNRDIAACTSSFLTCIQKPKEVPDSIIKLSATTFVQSVEAPALAVMVPLLIKGLREETVIKRKTAVIIANMSKLVTNPADACLFLPKLLPRLEQAAKETPDPECRGVCAMAMATVKRVADEGATLAEEGGVERGGGGGGGGRKVLSESEVIGLLSRAVTPALEVPVLDEAEGGEGGGEEKQEVESNLPIPTPTPTPTPKTTLSVTDPFVKTSLEFAAAVLVKAAALSARQIGGAAPVSLTVEEVLEKAVKPYLAHLVFSGGQIFSSSSSALGLQQKKTEALKQVAQTYTDLYLAATKPLQVDDDEDDNGIPPLCDCEFSLAYGGKILLNNARLRLRRGRRYGLCGHNGVGKSTLMRAINAEKVDGFPPASQVCTVYLESDVDPALAELPCVEFVFQDPTLKTKAVAPTEEEVVRTLELVGFDAEKRQMACGRLSGGWRMKLALARAMLMKPDILLLDEPTNHLDVTNVAWLENYLSKEIPHVTCLIVSHDSSFLDTVCTDIMHYEQRKLRYYHGNLSEFVKVKPEAKSYYTLQAATLRFNFPKPTFLDGVTSQEKPLLSLKKVTFAYPGAPKPQLVDVTCACRLGSRVSVLGPNGAGKSTLIKLLTGEMKPDKGSLVKHPHVRVAYVSQHALHHLEDHLDKTPNQYLRKRYASGEDKEENEKVTRKLSDEEQRALMNQVWMIDGQKRILNKLVNRRKKKKSFDYEVSWQGLSSIEFNRWITRDELIERGFEKLVNEMDGKILAEKGESAARPLTIVSVEQYLQDFGLEPEFGTHSAIRGLSGGQKVKLVLAAAMWHCPHLLILDEPTNYLDRDSLGALATAIKEFEGGVVMISHHNEFVGALSNEIWDLKEGKLTCHAKTKEGEGDAK
eukprot:CAMPEP_0175048820 /NCGR_PEP_ID=MMETSP0052_2-20121109/6407_1 /TAXON_ID=51329 ORGANISM="Polytomella parva, Strain SAG 63-3" /NCGR_SAMPLE_ID=MMETSP0052_2 /ASSEMBLY_ACC=CAM_ASM_000194 /LENGTH=1151 /DNA_ID=CAMNT_0016312937 /DNA_START=110 /DNA_END=3568 /DNA_ORIENTATION=+